MQTHQKVGRAGTCSTYDRSWSQQPTHCSNNSPANPQRHQSHSWETPKRKICPLPSAQGSSSRDNEQTLLGNSHRKAFKRLGQMLLESMGIFSIDVKSWKVKPPKFFLGGHSAAPTPVRRKDYCTTKMHQRLGAQRVPITGYFLSVDRLSSSLCGPEIADPRQLTQSGILRNKDGRLHSYLCLVLVEREGSKVCFVSAQLPTRVTFPPNAVLGFTTSMTEQAIRSCLSLWEYGRKHNISEQTLPKECEWILFRFILTQQENKRQNLQI